MAGDKGPRNKSASNRLRKYAVYCEVTARGTVMHFRIEVEHTSRWGAIVAVRKYLASVKLTARLAENE